MLDSSDLDNLDAPAAAARSTVIDGLGFAHEMAALDASMRAWLAQTDAEMRDALEWHFQGGSKYFRPMTVFSCYRAIHPGPLAPMVLRSAQAIEIFHNVSLVVDDILDRSDERRGRLTLQKKYGDLKSLMTSGYMTAEAFKLLRDDPEGLDLMAELMTRLASAECLQWRLRQQPLGVEDWRRIAGEDTGSMFEVAACLGDRSEALRRYGHLLGLLYHGCDDVGDVRGAEALGGGGVEDLRDGILTLPAALAIRDPNVAKMFCAPAEGDLPRLAEAFSEQLPEAELYLDTIAGEALSEARLFSRAPDRLLKLVDYTRELSRT